MTDLTSVAIKQLAVAAKQTDNAVSLLEKDFPNKLEFGQELVTLGNDMRVKAVAINTAIINCSVTMEMVIALQETIDEYQSALSAGYNNWMAHVAAKEAIDKASKP